MQILGRTLLAAALLAGSFGVVYSVLNAKSANPVGLFPKPAVDEPVATSKGIRETAVLSGGCFWGVQAVYQHTKGVLSATATNH